MKISAASFLLAFAGFFQESICMNSSDVAVPDGSIELTLPNGAIYTGDLYKVDKDPFWMHDGAKFRGYEVVVHRVTDFEAIYKSKFLKMMPPYDVITAVPYPDSVKIRFNNLYFTNAYDSFKPYALRKTTLLHKDYAFVTIPGGKSIYHAILELENPENRPSGSAPILRRRVVTTSPTHPRSYH